MLSPGFSFLVKSNEYPLIDLKREQAGALPARAFVLGHSESHSLLYWPERPEPGIWWVDKTAHLPALQQERMVDLFEYMAERNQERKKSRFTQAVGKQDTAP